MRLLLVDMHRDSLSVRPKHVLRGWASAPNLAERSSSPRGLMARETLRSWSPTLEEPTRTCGATRNGRLVERSKSRRALEFAPRADDSRYAEFVVADVWGTDADSRCNEKNNEELDLPMAQLLQVPSAWLQKRVIVSKHRGPRPWIHTGDQQATMRRPIIYIRSFTFQKTHRPQYHHVDGVTSGGSRKRFGFVARGGQDSARSRSSPMRRFDVWFT